ncbi:MAG: Cell division protein FtsH (EC [uncultured Sulfurovum sp.]|uniref:Cell division protein FtsH (EC) n=1 Tax=uncultured Sulfurovum sp. TaxID=269237 RepID=A0A6S6THX4_9BACT|nr:MAG: Cell division protein FtsH (EC [uncultured Sulfurovum sp.]
MEIMQIFDKKMNPTFVNHKNIKIIVGLIVLLVLLLSFTFMRDTHLHITHKQANTLYSANKIEKIIVDGEYIRLHTKDGKYKIYKDAINKNLFFEKFPVEVKENNSYIYDISFLLILVGGLWYFMAKTRKQQINQMRISRQEESKISEPVQALTSTVTFKDVAGINDVKEELEEIIDFLGFPQKYRDLDIRLPKGVLLVGPPGVGKTLISKAVAGEANVPFFYQSGASFVHIYVGMGAKRVSELFKKAKQMAPSIIFIDEIDAVGKSRGEFRNDEREATLNQLLTEMDGFEENSGVIVIGATNKVDALDEALLRAGRFDRRIHISLPDLQDRQNVLSLYLKNKPHSVNIEEVSRMTVGFNAAALDTLTNEAAIYAMRQGRKTVETSDFEEVKEKVFLGKRKVLSFTDEEREIQAVYQSAKAVVATWLDIEYDKIGILNTRLIMQEGEILSRTKLIHKIKFHLAGSIATKQRYKEQYSNAAVDIVQAKELVRKVIYDYAMSDTFIATSVQEDALMRESVEELTTLLSTLEPALTEVGNYLLTYENITNSQCKEILREIF